MKKANSDKSSDRNILYQALMGVGFLALIAWFYLMRELDFMTWVTSLGPESHTGAMNMLAIMIWMLPAFLCWKYYVRYLHRKLNIRGIFYEDHYYGKDEKSEQQPGSTATSSDNRDSKSQSKDHHNNQGN